MNNIPICVYKVEHDVDTIYPLYITKKSGKDPINLLMIQGEEHYHFAWNKNFNALLHRPGSENTKVFCPYCCYGFVKRRNREFNLVNHKLHCRSYGAQRTSFLPEGENFIKFKEFRKMQKSTFCIYSDFETINKKVDNTEYINEDEDSKSGGMRYKTNHQVSRFTFYTVSDYFTPKIVS